MYISILESLIVTQVEGSHSVENVTRVESPAFLNMTRVESLKIVTQVESLTLVTLSLLIVIKDPGEIKNCFYFL